MQTSALSSEQIARRTLRGAAMRFVAQYGSAVIGVIKVYFLFRLVSQEIVGVVAYAAVISSLLLIFRMDLRPVVIRTPGNTQPARLATQYGLELTSAITGLIIGGLAYLLLPALLSPVHWLATFLLIFLGPTGVLQALLSTPLYLLERDIRHDITSTLTVISALLGMAVSITLAYFGQPLWALIADTALLTAVPGIGAWIVTRWRPVWHWDPVVAKEIWAFGTTVWTTGLLGIITFQFDDGLVGTFRGDRALGFYSQAYLRAKIPLDVFGGVVAGMSLPLYSQSLAAGRETLRRAYAQTTWILARLIAMSSIVLLAATEEIVRLWVGDAWLPLVPLIRLMALFIVGRPLFQNHGIVLLPLGKERQFRFIVFIQAAILLAAGLPAVLIWGEEGVAVVVSIMMLVGLVISEIYVTRLIGLSALPIYALPGLLTLLLTPLLYWLGLLLGMPLLLALIAKTAAAFLLFGGAMILLEREQLIQVIGLLREHLFRAKPQPTAALGTTE